LTDRLIGLRSTEEDRDLILRCVARRSRMGQWLREDALPRASTPLLSGSIVFAPGCYFCGQRSLQQ
jgi:hypothetical protein